MMLRPNIPHALDRGLAPAAPGDRPDIRTQTIDPRPGDQSANPTLSVEVLRQFDEVPSDVALLFASAELENVESGLAWYKNLVKSVYPDHNGLSIYVLRQNGQAIALLPVLAQGQPGAHCIKSLGNYYTTLYAPYFAPQVTAHDLAVLLRTFRDGQSPLTSLQLAPMDPNARSHQLLLGAMKIAGLRAFEFFCSGNWYLPVNRDWPTYFCSRESKIRNTVRRTGKAFSAGGGTLELVTGGPDLERGISAYLRVYAASWKQAEPYPDFMPGLIRACAERGWLRLGLAWLNGEAIAAQVWIVANSKASIYKLAYDNSAKKFAPGTLLTSMLMQHVIERDQVAEVDYLIGDDPYKKAWMSHRRERWGIVAYNPRTLRGLLGLSREVLGRAVKTAVAHARALADRPKQAKSAGAIPDTSTWHWRAVAGTELSRISKQWQTDCDNASQSPLVSADIVDIALQHFGRGGELISLAEASCGPVAATILQRKKKLVWQTIQLSQMARGPWLQLLQVHFSAVLRSLLRALPAPAVTIGISQHDSELSPKADTNAMRTLDSITTGQIAFPDALADYTESWPAKPRGELMRCMRKGANECGPITPTTATEPDAVESFVRLYASMESRSCKADAGTAIAQNDGRSDFYVDLLRGFAATGCARMYTLKMGERMVAAQIEIVKDDVLYCLKATYEPALNRLGPGVMLKYHMMPGCYEHAPRIKRMECCGPLNESQHMWITGSRSIYHANAYRFNVLAQVHGLWVGGRAAISKAFANASSSARKYGVLASPNDVDIHALLS